MAPEPAPPRLLEHRLREMLETVALVAAAIDEHGTVTFANDFLLELVGRSRDEVVGHDWFEVFGDDPFAREDYYEWMRTGELQPHFESEIVAEEGERRLIRWSSTLQRHEDGTPAGIVTIGEDITERRRAVETLRAREAFFRSLIENASDMIGITDVAGLVCYESPAVERVLGWRPEEVVGTSLLDLVHPDDRGDAERIFAAALGGGEPEPTEVRLRAADGGYRVVEAVCRRSEQDGEPVVVGNYRDVTEEVRLREQLFHAQKLEALGRLAGGIAHDFNNLLTAIGGYSQFLAAGFDDGDPRREDALEIVRATERAAGLTAQLLAFSRRQVLEAEVLDLGAVIAELGRLLGRLLGAEIRLVADVEPGCFVRADRSQLEQVITNLAVNARDAMPGGGTLELAVRAGDDEVELLVRDTGVGMDAATLQHVFEPFFTTKEPGKGTGLGLAMVYGIVSQSGGAISVVSEPGAGTTFRVTLPRVEPVGDAAAEPEAEGAQPAGAVTESVLLVEDEETIRRLVADVLGRHGYSVQAAASGAEALALLERGPDEVQLLLTDVVMPGMSGPELARAATALNPELRILYTSGYASGPEEAYHGPHVHFIGKPFAPQELVAKVREVLDAA